LGVSVAICGGRSILMFSTFYSLLGVSEEKLRMLMQSMRDSFYSLLGVSDTADSSKRRGEGLHKLSTLFWEFH